MFSFFDNPIFCNGKYNGKINTQKEDRVRPKYQCSTPRRTHFRRVSVSGALPTRGSAAPTPCRSFIAFGSLCWKWIPDQLRQKLDDKGVPQVLVGYHLTGGYRLFDLETNQVSISRDVVIDKSAEWNMQ